MRRVSCVTLLVVLLCTSSGPVLAEEEIVKEDGSTIRGELIGYDKDTGEYALQIGCFTKKINQSEIKEIRDLGSPGATTSKPVAVEAPQTKAPSDPSSVLPGGGGGGQLDMQSLMSQITQMKGQSPALGNLLQMQQNSGSAGPLDPSSLSPGMAAQLQQQSATLAPLMNRFKDKGFQRQLIENVKKMRQALNVNGQASSEDDPSIKQLENLFNQLNSMEGQSQGQ